jgi:photosynthetic reaction center cytochrome c subunit
MLSCPGSICICLHLSVADAVILLKSLIIVEGVVKLMSGHVSNAIRAAILALSILLVFVLLIHRSAAQNPPTAPQTPVEQTVEQAHKNIQVLKGLPESQLIPVMNYMSASLGVRCNYCHVQKDGNWDFPSDEKGEKKAAREMITMVTSVNKSTFKGNAEVSCYTCHRGKTSVVHTLSMPLPTPEPRQQPSAGQGQQREALPTAEQVLDKYYQALGGAAAIDKLKSRVMKGTLTTANGEDLGYELRQSGPEMVLATITTPQMGVIERGFNGRAGWEKSTKGVRDLGSEELTYLRRYPDLYTDTRLAGQFSRISVAGKSKIEGRDVYVLRATTTGGKREQLYFDAETGLLIRRTTSTTTPVGVIPEQVDFSDYREVDGLKVPFTVRVSTIDPNYSVVRKFTEIKLNVPVDTKQFNKPA